MASTPPKTSAPAAPAVPDGLRLEYMPLASLQEATRNPKQHATKDLSTSIGRFGYVEPIVLDERTQRLVAGHGRRESLMAMKEAGQDAPSGIRTAKDGEWLVPVMRGWASRSDTEADAYLIASNRLTEAGGWDNGSLVEMLRELEAADALDGVGFDAKALSELLDEAGPEEGNTDVDEVPEVDDKDVHVQAGDVWVLGDHRIICGSSTVGADVDRVMRGELARICWTDPPWNVAYGEASGSKKHDAIANDDLGEDFPQFVAAFTAEMKRVMYPGAILYMAMSAQEWPTIGAVLKEFEFKWSSTIIWVKDSLVLSRSDYHRQYEPIWYGWRGDAARLQPVEDRKQSDVWEIARPKKSDQHPTMKPVELITRSLQNSSKRGDIVFEPFSGSGSTLMACEQTGRACRAVELMPKYVQVAIERWEAFTGRKAKLEEP